MAQEKDIFRSDDGAELADKEEEDAVSGADVLENDMLMVLELRGTRRAMLNRIDEPDIRRSSSRDSWRRAGEVNLGPVRLTVVGD